MKATSLLAVLFVLILSAGCAGNTGHVAAQPTTKVDLDALISSILSWGTFEYRHILEDPTLVNARNENGETPLHSAALVGDMETMWLLLYKGADVNAKDKDGVTPLLLRILFKGAGEDFKGAWPHEKLVKLLISKGADVNAKDKEGRTPLSVAIKTQQVEVADILIAHGAKE